MSDYANVMLAVASGVIGGGFALLGQYGANRATTRRHSAELAQRSEELAASFSLPLVARRAEALEELFDLLQKTVEERAMSMADYERVRRLLIYVPSELTSSVLDSLTRVLRGHRTSSHDEADRAIDGIVKLQSEIRAAAGLIVVERYVKQLTKGRQYTESEAI